MKSTAENVGHYWKTSRTGTEAWLEKIERQIKRAGGNVTAEGAVRQNEHAAIMVAFELNNDTFRLVWPVLHSSSGNRRAAQIQAATALYHDVKARCVRARFHGSRVAFIDGLILPSGQTVSESSLPELMSNVPQLLGGPVLLEAGEWIEEKGE